MIIARAPLRIPLGGGGTDLSSFYSKHGGFVVSAAIDKYVFISLNRLKIEDFVRVKYSKTELVEDPSCIRHPLLREALILTGVNRSVEIAAMADVPAGTGLGSSGSFLTALLTALHAFKREHIPPQVLAEEACEVEIERAGQPVGKQDQYIAAFGGLVCMDIARDGEVTVTPLRISAHTLDELRSSTLLFYTGMRRSSFDILGEQKKDTDRGDQDVIENLLVTKEIGLHVKRALEDGDIVRFGELLHAHWENKKRRSGKITNPEIDRWYRAARESGALGGKIMGAGGGGFFMFCAPNDRKAQVREAMAREGLREMPFEFDLEGAKVLVNF